MDQLQDQELLPRVEIFINTAPHIHHLHEIHFARVVDLSGVKAAEGQQYSVTYSDGPAQNIEGEMTLGESVKIQNGMIFDVSTTYRS